MLRFVCVVSALCLPAQLHAEDFRNDVVTRHIDVTTSLHKTTLQLKITALSESAATYYMVLPTTKSDKLCMLEIKSSESGEQLVTKGAEKSPEGYQRYAIQLNPALAAGETTSLEVLVILSHQHQPLPKHIRQGQRQLMQIHDNHFLLSPYPSVKQTTEVALPSTYLLESSMLQPSSISGKRITYGLLLHFESNFPFATFRTVNKEIEVSHWGNVAVEELYSLEHTGATLKGGFSRAKYARRDEESPSFNMLTALLPLRATNVYYRDVIGNVSTSWVRKEEEYLHAEFSPRFPMLGGWQTQFFIGYNLPAQVVLSATTSNDYVMDVDISLPFTQVAADSLRVAVVLPEGATDIRVDDMVGGTQEEEERSRRFTFLDSWYGGGRPVVRLRKHNLAPQQRLRVQIHYKFSRLSMLIEPMLISIFFFSCFFMYILSSHACRLLSLSPSSKPKQS